jgi:hypothetical protein
MSLQVTGFMGGARALQELAAELDKGIPETIIPAAQKTIRAQKQLCPVRTGFLRNSIQLMIANGNELRMVVTARYAGFVENGTWRMPARPFFFPPIFSVFLPELKKANIEWKKKVDSKFAKARGKP